MTAPTDERSVTRLAAPRSAIEVRGQTLFLALCALIALAPLPLGAARPLAWDLIGLAVAALLVLTLRLPARDISAAQTLVVGPLLLFLIVGGFVVFQISFQSPARWHNFLWAEAGEALGQDIQGAIAIERVAALVGLFRLISYAGVFYLTVVLCRDSARALTIMKVLAISGGVYAAYGLIVFWSGNQTILWFAKWTYLRDLTGPFVNRNSFATYLGLCLLATLGNLAISFQNLRLVGTWRDKTATAVEFFSTRSWLLICLFVLLTALALTHSRGGFIATTFGVFALGFAISRTPSLGKLRRLGWWVTAIPLALGGGAFLISGGTILERLIGTDSDSEGRVAVFALTWKAIGDYPILGTGLNSFSALFPLYRTTAVRGYYDLAHNDYLQNLLELGIPAAVVLFTAVAWLIGLCVRGMRERRRDGIFPCLGVAASVLVAVHATVDFSLQIPAVTMTYLVLLGLGVAQSQSSQRSETQSPSASVDERK